MDKEDYNESVNAERDWLLEMIIKITESSNMELGITIHAHGFLVSGIIVNSEGYFDRLGQIFDKGLGGDKERVAVAFKGMGESIGKKSKDSDVRNFLHLKDAKYFHSSGKPIPNSQTILWRGRINEISGFSLGTLNASFE